MYRPDRREEVKVFPLKAGWWFRLGYELVEEQGDVYIAVKDNSYDPQVILYPPLDLPPLKRQPKHREGWQKWPHLHLARLNTQSNEEILEFANRWGLLGLWNIEGYCDWHPAGEEYEPYRFKGHATWFSRYFVDQRHEGERYKMYREPLEAFAWAAQEFQRFVALANGSPKEKTEAEDVLNRYLADCRPISRYADKGGWFTFWQAPSLLQYCYLCVWLDLTGSRLYHRCQHRHCGALFIATRPNVEYCSNQCHENAKRLRYYRRHRTVVPEGRLGSKGFLKTD